ncbi:MAG: hypothetical protein KAT11_07720, partial [Phycisphaerae bacterium]|nr:hypothetical protein [Phycisphaerae bacterium]
MKIDTEILCSFIDGELDEQTSRAVRAALETDQKLRREYEGLCKTAQLVRSLPRVSAPPELATTITAHAERSQLLGPTESRQSRPSRFRWTLSMAASLLVGASLGILGYHAWPSRVAPSREPSELVITTRAERYVPKDSPEMIASRRITPSPKPRRDLDGEGLEAPGRASGEITAGLPGRPSETPYAAKGGVPIARTGPAKGPLAKSRGADFEAAADAIVTNGRLAEAEQTQELAGALKAPRKEAAQVVERGATDASASARGLPRSRGKAGDTSEESLRAGITVQKALTGRKNIPLERQVR